MDSRRSDANILVMPRPACRDVVDATVGERAAPRDPPCGHRAALEDPVDPDRVLSVVGTGRVEAALASEPPRERHPVELDEPEERQPRGGAGRPPRRMEPGHEVLPRARANAPSISATRSCVMAPRMVARATHATS